MKHIVTLIIMVCLIGLNYSLTAQTVYSVSSDTGANVKVYAITDSTMADLWVFQASSDAGVGANNGIWFFTADAASASKKLFFTNNLNDAEVWIYYTSIQSNAGWKNVTKTVLMN